MLVIFPFFSLSQTHKPFFSLYPACSLPLLSAMDCRHHRRQTATIVLTFSMFSPPLSLFRPFAFFFFWTFFLWLYIYIYTHTHTHTHTYIYIYTHKKMFCMLGTLVWKQKVGGSKKVESNEHHWFKLWPKCPPPWSWVAFSTLKLSHKVSSSCFF